MTQNWNPRFVVWARSRGAKPEDFNRDEHGDIRKVDDGHGNRLPWTLVFSFWIRDQWRTWAAELGFTKSDRGWMPHELALSNGHTHEDFDRWLNDRF